MATRKVNILSKKPDKRKAITKDKANKRAKGEDDDVILIEDPTSTVVIDDDDDDDGYAPLALPMLPSKPATKPPPKRVATTRSVQKISGNKKLIVVPVSALGNSKMTAKDVLSSNVVKSALSSLSNKSSPPPNKTTSTVNSGNLKTTAKPSETSKSLNKIVPEVDNKIKVKLGPEVSIVSSKSVQPVAPTGDHDYFSVNSTPAKKPLPPLTIIKSPLKNNLSALNSVKAPLTNVNITPPTKDILNSYPIPDNLKIDLNSNKITIGNEVCTVNSFQYCGNHRMKVFVAATDKSPARTIVLRKMPEQSVKDMKNVATVFNPPKSPAKNPTMNKVNTPVTTPKTTPQLTRPQTTPASTTPGALPPSKTPVFVIKPSQKEKRQKMLEDAKATRKLLDEISKAMDLEEKKSTKSCSSESSVPDYPKEKHGRRWSELNKLHSVAIHQSCPKRYKLLNTIFAMPTKRSVLSSFRRIKVSAGVNSQMLYLFHSMTSSLLKNEQPYAIIFDIVTFTLKNKVPEYCLIFYLKSLTSGVEQVAGFWAQLQTFSAEKISTCIKEMVSACQNVGLFVCCIVGDSKYLRVLNQLGVTEKDPFFETNGRKIFAIFEPKNLLVSTRNTFFKHDIHIEDKGEKLLASWRHIKDCVTFDRVNTYQQMPKIDDSVLECEKFDKAKFSNARKVLSYKMGSCINGYICSGYVDKSALGSATYIVKLNQVFNSFFGKSESSGVNCLLQKSKENSHLKLWSTSYEEMKKWKYINNIKSFTPQCQKCLLINLKSLPLLWLALKGNGATTFKLNKLSTRPIEKFVIRLKKKLPKGKNVSIIPSLAKAVQTAIDSTIKQTVSIVNENKSKYESLTDFIEHLTSSETYDQFIQDVDVRVKHEVSSDESDDEK